ncbi:MAG: ABC transporter permease [Bacteroidales bacterium]|jgi:molybdate/tungstate transport system permease protein|nr:ABC transporter permease [Bacteroidales bacterium]NPV35386.1 ABC transporter permease [Bacteroidales bacterium]
MKKNSGFYFLIIFLSGLLLIFIVAPMVGMVLSSSTSKIFDTAQDPQFRESLRLTLLTSAAATLVGAIGAIPLAWLLARHEFPLKRILTGIIDLPIVIPHTAAGVAILGFVSRDTLIGRFADMAGLNLVGSPLGISLAMAFVSLPFLINAARSGFEAVPLRLEQAAATLGASPARILLTISIPMASRSLIAGLVLMFARGLSEFGAVVIVAYHPMVTPVYLFDRLNNFGIEYATPVAILLLGVSLGVFILSRALSKDNFYARNQRHKTQSR